MIVHVLGEGGGGGSNLKETQFDRCSVLHLVPIELKPDSNGERLKWF